jgi:hypothetical protein
MQGLEEQVVAEALYAIGEINLRRGELGAAENRFVRAHEMGRDPQPGLAALRLAQGKIDAAVTGLRLSLASADEPIQPRARLLAAQVEVLIAAQDVRGARGPVGALEKLASEEPSALLEATAVMARASLHLAEGRSTRRWDVHGGPGRSGST